MGPASASDIAVKIRLDRATIVRNLKRMEEQEFIDDISPKGARNRQLKLTEKELETFENAEILWSEAQDYIEQH